MRLTERLLAAAVSAAALTGTTGCTPPAQHTAEATPTPASYSSSASHASAAWRPHVPSHTAGLLGSAAAGAALRRFSGAHYGIASSGFGKSGVGRSGG
jgi:hypothetical protein